MGFGCNKIDAAVGGVFDAVRLRPIVRLPRVLAIVGPEPGGSHAPVLCTVPLRCTGAECHACFEVTSRVL